jgi:hypothetical protein
MRLRQNKNGKEAMLSVKGTFQNGVAHPAESIAGRNGQAVIITFLEEGDLPPKATANETAWDALQQLVENCTVETDISDLAHQHDHYLYGKPKQE